MLYKSTFWFSEFLIIKRQNNNRWGIMLNNTTTSDRLYKFLLLMSIVSLGVLIGLISINMYIYLGIIILIILLLVIKGLCKEENILAIAPIIGMIKMAPGLALLQQVIDLTLVFEILVLCIALYYIFIKKRKVFTSRESFVFATLIVIISTLALIIAPKTCFDYSINKYFRFIIINIISKYLITMIIVNSKKQIKNMLMVYLVIGFLIGIYAVVTQNRNSFVSTYISAAKLELICSAIWISLFAAETQKVYRKFVFVILGIFMLYVGFFCGARGPVISIILSYILYLIFIIVAKKDYKTLKFIVKSISFFMILVILSLKFQLIPEVFIERFSLIISGLSNGDYGSSINTRLDYSKVSYDIITEKPLFGAGLGTFLYYAFGIPGRGYPHNIFLEIWGEMGIFAVILFIVIFARTEIILFKHIKNAKQDIPLVRTLFILFNITIIEAQFSGNLLDHKLLWFFMALIYSYDLSIKKVKKQ